MKRGFTLIELLVVVAIIGIMMAGALTSISSGRDAARARDAARGVAQMVHYANALALLRQRPVVLTYSTEESDGEKAVRIDVRLSGESMAAAASSEPADPIYREVDGQDTSAAGAEAAKEAAAEDEQAEVGGTTAAEKAGLFFTRKILDPDELAKEDAMRSFEGLYVETEMLGEDGAQVDEQTGRALNEQAEGILNNRVTAIKAWSNTQGEIDTSKTEADEQAEKAAAAEPRHVIFETNGSCQPHRVTLRTVGSDGKDGKDDADGGVLITVSRSCKVTIGDGEEDDDR